MKQILILLVIVALSACQSKPSKNSQELPVALIKYHIEVTGMTCEGCESAVNQGVMALDGVNEIKASHVDSNAIVMLDTSALKIAEVVAAIEQTGFVPGDYKILN